MHPRCTGVGFAMPIEVTLTDSHWLRPSARNAASPQGLTFVHFSAQCKRCFGDTWGTVGRYMGHNSSHTWHNTAQ
jgi:hypothetical protein